MFTVLSGKFQTRISYGRTINFKSRRSGCVQDIARGIQRMSKVRGTELRGIESCIYRVSYWLAFRQGGNPQFLLLQASNLKVRKSKYCPLVGMGGHGSCPGDLLMLLILLLVFQHHWTPPKGHLDQLSSGEWEEELVAALRETEEEAGIGKNHLQVWERDRTSLFLYECILNIPGTWAYQRGTEVRSVAETEGVCLLFKRLRDGFIGGLVTSCEIREN